MDKLTQHLIESKGRFELLKKQIEFNINLFDTQIKEIQSTCKHENSFCTKIHSNLEKHCCLDCGADFWKEK
jgi:hypothetical protein